jgi:hypothetical protein
MQIVVVKSGQTAPKLALQLTSAGQPVDLTGAQSVQLTLVARRSGTAVIDASAMTIDSTATGLVSHDWPEDLAPGYYAAEIRVTDAGGKITPYPDGEYIPILAEPSLFPAS